MHTARGPNRIEFDHSALESLGGQWSLLRDESQAHKVPSPMQTKANDDYDLMGVYLGSIDTV